MPLPSTSYDPIPYVPTGAEYPYPSNLSPPSFTSVKLSGRDNYCIWKTQMLCLLRSHRMFGFTDETPVTHQTGVSGKEIVGGDHCLSNDTVIKGWILGSLSEEPLSYVLNCLTKKKDFRAKDVWDELKTIYGPRDKEEEEKAYHPTASMYEAITQGSWKNVEYHLTKAEPKLKLVENFANNGDTALHVAVGNSNNEEFIRKLLDFIPENTQLSNVKNSDGSTLLHIAAMTGDVEVAEVLVEKSPELLFTEDNLLRLPLAIALLNVDVKMSKFLRNQMTRYEQWSTMLSSNIGDELLVILISSKKFDEALEWLLHSEKPTYYSDTVLMAIAQNFPPELNTLEHYIVSYDRLTDRIRRSIKSVLNTPTDYIAKRCVPLCGSWPEKIFNLLNTGIIWMIMLLPLIPKMLVWPFIEKTIRIHNDAGGLLWHVCFILIQYPQPLPKHHYYTNPILEATRQNAYEVVNLIMLSFPNAIWSTNEEGHNIIQYAVINRSENVYNVLYNMGKQKNVYKTIRDSSQNNLLHLAARLAPTKKLNLISGAALQLQRELQWYKEVERFASPLSRNQMNSFGETPQMVFTKEHKHLVIEGEKWIKATAESYTITAALITTIVFAAAITVPGGNNQDTGIPIFTNNIAFTIFAISDAISLFMAVTSLLIFLSILTSRFAQQDFLYKLPTKMILGLFTLFISTTTMIVAFGATLYLVFGQRNSMILIPIVVLTCLTITSFIFSQFSLIKDLTSATYFRSIFGKKRDVSYY